MIPTRDITVCTTLQVRSGMRALGVYVRTRVHSFCRCVSEFRYPSLCDHVMLVLCHDACAYMHIFTYCLRGSHAFTCLNHLYVTDVCYN